MRTTLSRSASARLRPAGRARRATSAVVLSVALLATNAPSASAAGALPAPPTRFSTANAATAWHANSFAPTLATAEDAVRTWNGSVAGCKPGTRSSTELDAALALINVHRDAASVPKLTGTHAESNRLAQAASLILEANNKLDHSPSSSDACWTADGDRGAGQSNIALGRSMAGQVVSYMIEPGNNNDDVGHRQWLLSPKLAQVGIGGTTRGAAIRVIGVPTVNTSTARSIPWPPAGYVPGSIVPPRWSLSFHNTSADLSDATVRVTANGRALDVIRRKDTSGYGGLETVVFDLPSSTIAAAVGGDGDNTVFRVTVSGIKGASSSTYSYTTTVASNRFIDDDGHMFEQDILKLAKRGITLGCNPPTNDKFCPDSSVTRGQMATFFVRALNLPATSRDYFRDDNGSPHEDAINRLAASGITSGCNPPHNTSFCPNGSLTRGQMAKFFERALKLPATSRDYFTDDRGNVFEPSINRFAAKGITKGCSSTRYCPSDRVTRGQMAAFFVRAGLA